MNTKSSWGYCLVLGLVLMCFYIVTMPPDITFEDTAIFAGACATLGLVHPPGYPLHTITCAPFTMLAPTFLLSFAQGAAIASALAAASACALLALQLKRMYGNWSTALFSASVVGLAPSFVSQAQIPESYALNILLIVITLMLVDTYIKKSSKNYLVALALVTGLGLSNHWPLYVLIYPTFLFYLAPHYKQVINDISNWRTVLFCALAFMVGLLPYLHLVIVSSDAFLFDKEYGIDKMVGYIRRDVYGLGADNINFYAHLKEMTRVAILPIQEFFYVFGIFGLAGLYMLGKERNWWLLASILWGMLCCTVLLAALRPYDPYSELSNWIVSVYILPSFIFLAIALNHVLVWLVDQLKITKATSLGVATGVIALIIILSYPKLNRSDDDIAYVHTNAIIDELPKDGLLIEIASDFAFPTRYLQYFRDDLESERLVSESNYFEGLTEDATLSKKDEAKLASENRPVFYTRSLELKTIGASYHGTHFSIDSNTNAGEVSINITPKAREVFRKMITLQHAGIRNAFTRVYVSQALTTYANHVVRAKAHGQEINVEDIALLAEVLTTPQGQFGKFISTMLDKKNPVTPSTVFKALEQINPYMAGLDGQSRSSIISFAATTEIQLGNLERGKELFELAYYEYPSLENVKVIIDLLQVYAELDEFEAYRKLRFDVPGLGEGKSLSYSDKECAVALRIRRCTP